MKTCCLSPFPAAAFLVFPEAFGPPFFCSPSRNNGKETKHRQNFSSSPHLITLHCLTGTRRISKSSSFLDGLCIGNHLFEVHTQDDQNNWKIVLEQEVENNYSSCQTQEPRKHLNVVTKRTGLFMVAPRGASWMNLN